MNAEMENPWPAAVLRNVVKTTHHAECHPLPLHPVSAHDLFLPVEEHHGHRPRWSWFWTGFTLATSMISLGLALVLR